MGAGRPRQPEPLSGLRHAARNRLHDRLRARRADIYGNAIPTDYTLSFKTGKIEPWARLPYAGERLSLTSAYREDTRIALAVEGRPEVQFALYRVPTEQIGTVFTGYLDDNSPLARDDYLVALSENARRRAAALWRG